MRHQPATLDVGRAALEPHDVRLAQPKLGRVLDRDHPLVRLDEAGEGVEQGRLAGAGPAADQDAAPRRDRRRELVVELLRQRAQLDQLARARAAPPRTGGSTATGRRPRAAG